MGFDQLMLRNYRMNLSDAHAQVLMAQLDSMNEITRFLWKSSINLREHPMAQCQTVLGSS